MVQELVALREQMHALQQATAHAASVSELHQALRLLERDTEMIKKKLTGGLLAALGADAAALAGAARQSDLLEVVAALERKVEKDEVQRILRQAVAMALSAYRSAAEAAAAEAAAAGQPGRALKSKCLSCDRDVTPFRPPPLGPLPSAAGLLPTAERFKSLARPSTAPQGPGLNAAEFRRMQTEAFASPEHNGGKSVGENRGGRKPGRPGVGTCDSARPMTASSPKPVFN
jgi:hypothetical protein